VTPVVKSGVEFLLLLLLLTTTSGFQRAPGGGGARLKPDSGDVIVSAGSVLLFVKRLEASFTITGWIFPGPP